MDVLDRVRRSKQKNTIDQDHVNQYLEDINAKAIEKARAEMLVEVETAKAEIVKITAERDALTKLQETDSSTIESLKVKCKELESGRLEALRQVAVYRQDSFNHGLQLDKARGEGDQKQQTLELQIASLEGRLSAKPAPQAPAPIMQPRALPTLKVTPIRNQNGRIESATIEPIVSH